MWIKIIDGERYEFSNDYYKCIYNGKKYTCVDEYHHCILCGCFMDEYCADKDDVVTHDSWINPLGVDGNATNSCPHCGAKYNYIEGDQLVLSDDELKMIYDKRKRDHSDEVRKTIEKIPTFKTKEKCMKEDCYWVPVDSNIVISLTVEQQTYRITFNCSPEYITEIESYIMGMDGEILETERCVKKQKVT